MQLDPKTEGINITVVGSFTPYMFRPTWFARHNLISLEETKSEIGAVIVAENLAHFNLSDWLSIHVEERRFQASTNQPQKYEALRDVVVGTFRLLGQTPLNQLGINHEYHYQLPSKEIWNNLGHRLAPKEDWRDLLGEPGMLILEMQGKRNDDYNGYIRVKVESEHPDSFGVGIRVNDHYELRSGSTEDDFSAAVTLLSEVLFNNWQSSATLAKKVADKISALSIE